MPDPEAQVNGDCNIVLSLKSEPRCLGAILTCWLARAGTVSLKGAMPVYCLYMLLQKKKEKPHLSRTWKGQKGNLFFFFKA